MFYKQIDKMYKNNIRDPIVDLLAEETLCVVETAPPPLVEEEADVVEEVVSAEVEVLNPVDVVESVLVDTVIEEEEEGASVVAPDVVDNCPEVEVVGIDIVDSL